MKKYIIFGIIVVVAGLLYGVIDLAKAKKEKEPLISYNRDIRPVLSDKCFSCHGPDVSKVKAGLRLDLPASAFAESPPTPCVAAPPRRTGATQSAR